MGCRLLLVISAVILTSLLVDDVRAGRKDNGGRRRGGGQRGDSRGTRYHWTRDLEGGHSSPEEAVAIAERHLILFKSVDKNLTAAGFSKSTTLYDFSTTPAVTVISLLGKGKRSPCYLAETNLTYQGVHDTLTKRNGLTAPLGSQVFLNGSGNQLIRTQALAILASNPALRRVCKGGKIVRTSPTSEATATDTTEIIKVLTADTQVALTVSRGPQRSRNGTSRGRKSGGGRGNSNRGKN